MKLPGAILLLFVTLTIGCTKPPQQKTLYIIGNSAVKHGNGDGLQGLWGWGDFMNQTIDTTKMRVRNEALGKTSIRSFRWKGNWFTILDSLHEGDYVMIQFGFNQSDKINDSSCVCGTLEGIGDETQEIDNVITGEYEIVHTFGWYLKKYINEVKAKEAIPIIITPIPNNEWKNGKVVRYPNDCGLWLKQIAESEGVAIIDLNEKMALAMEQLGEKNKHGNYFYKHDHKNTTSKGALLNASLVTQTIQTNNICQLSKYIVHKPISKLPAKRKVLIIGDSMVEGNGDKSTGWGEMMPHYLDTIRLAIKNYAKAEASSRTFSSMDMWKEVEKQIKPGDFVLIQFGNNEDDEIDKGMRRGTLKGDGDQSEMSVLPNGKKEMVHTYGWYIRKYITETIAKGGIPIVMSPIPGNQWENNKVKRANDDYGVWAQEAAMRENSLFIDVNEALANQYESLGKDVVNSYFKNDNILTNTQGAENNALIISQLLSSTKNGQLADYVVKTTESNQMANDLCR